MRCRTWRVYANVRALFVPGHPSRSSYAHWPGLCACGKRVCMQTEVLNGSRPGAQHDTVGEPGVNVITLVIPQQPKELSEFARVESV